MLLHQRHLGRVGHAVERQGFADEIEFDLAEQIGAHGGFVLRVDCQRRDHGGAAALADRTAFAPIIRALRVAAGCVLHCGGVARGGAEHHLGADAAVAHGDPVQAQQHHRRQQLLAFGADLVAYLRQDLLFQQFGGQLLAVNAVIDQPDRAELFGARRELRFAFAGFGQFEHDIAGIARHQPVARLIEGDVFFGELIDRFGHRRHQAGVTFHLPDRGIDDRIEGAVHELRYESGEVDFVDHRTGASGDGLGGRRFAGGHRRRCARLCIRLRTRDRRPVTGRKDLAAVARGVGHGVLLRPRGSTTRRASRRWRRASRSRVRNGRRRAASVR